MHGEDEIVDDDSVKPEGKFIAYYDKLRRELNTAYLHYQIAKTLKSYQSTRSEEFKEAKTFFELSKLANFFSTIMIIGKFLDKSSSSIHLDSFFSLAVNNLHMFTAEAYQANLVSQGYQVQDVEFFLRNHKAITEGTVAEDREKVQKLPIQNIKVWRHKKLAHIEEAFVTGNMQLSEDFPIKVQEVDNVLLTLHEILNRYRLAFDGVQWIIGTPPVEPQMKFLFDKLNPLKQGEK